MTPPIDFLPHGAPAPAHADPAPPPPPLDRQFARFAREECDDPLYRHLADLAATVPARLSLLDGTPPTQARPVLWLAVLQDRLLELQAEGRRPALADWYPSVGGTRAPDDPALPAALDDFLAAEQPLLSQRAASRGTQTNEVGRSVVLAPLLAAVSARAGGRPVALLDVGCSAGLNLGVDRFHCRYLDPVDGRVLAERPGADDPAAADPFAGRVPVLEARLAGGLPPVGPLRLASRTGIDIAPVDVSDDRELRWLRACLWPSDAGRRERFDAAVALARQERWTVQRTEDVTTALEDWLVTVPRDVVPVAFNSWVLSYFDAARLDRHVRTLLHRVSEGRLQWISAEMPSVMRPAWPDLPAPDAPSVQAAARAGVGAGELADATAWTLARALPGVLRHEPSGAIDWRLAARSHAHGRWMQFAPA